MSPHIVLLAKICADADLATTKASAIVADMAGDWEPEPIEKALRGYAAAERARAEAYRDLSKALMRQLERIETAVNFGKEDVQP